MDWPWPVLSRLFTILDEVGGSLHVRVDGGKFIGRTLRINFFWKTLRVLLLIITEDQRS
jgi:hypothetical protein